MRPANNILDQWQLIMPDNNPRKSQQVTFDWIQSLSPDIKYILLEMPVGGGKSPVGLTVSSWLANSKGNSFILTPQKILQSQYESSFSSDILASMYGKVNYQCKPKDCSCEVGSSIKPDCSDCPHKAALKRALDSSNMVLNYTLALLYFAYFDDKKLPPRKLMVFDECHNLENELVNFSAFDISQFTCNKISNNTLDYYRPKSAADAYRWIIDEYSPILRRYVSELADQIKSIEEYATSSMKLSSSELAILKNYNVYSRHNDLINLFIVNGEDKVDDDYVVVVGDDKSFNVKELYGAKPFHNVVLPKAEKFLFMSSTILNKDGFCKDLNIDPSQAAFLSLNSEFDHNNRRVFYMPAARMNYGWDEHTSARIKARRNMVECIKSILNSHSNDSGIIHTGSYKLSNWLVNELQSVHTHNVLHHNSHDEVVVNRGDVIEEYMESAKVRPTVLISPSITEGLDLKYDLGRFAIFAKVPYPSLGDEWIKRRMELSTEWYQRQTLKEIIQGSGRVCRNHDDWGFTYILDESFSPLYDNTKNEMIPKWWLDAFERI